MQRVFAQTSWIYGGDIIIFWTQGYGGIGDDLSYFDLSRNLFETQCNGPTIQSTVTRTEKK